MKEKAIMVSTLLAVLVVGFIGMVGLTAQQTGLTIQRTSSVRQRGACCCEIQMFDFRGNGIGSQIQTITGVSRQARTDSACDNRCGIQFGRTSSARRQVSGWVC